MPTKCPKFGILLYGRRCTTCDCERSTPESRARLAEASDPRPAGGPVRREFVIVPRDPNQKPDVPLQVPRHYCLDCGQRVVPCFKCDVVTYPMTDVREGVHAAICPEHGPITIVCPRRGLHDAPPSIAGNSDQAEARQFLTAGILTRAQAREQAGMARTEEAALRQENDLLRERMTRAVTIGFLVGFILGFLIAGAVPVILHLVRSQASTQVE